jgi:CheY-like chemotaxis protein
MDQSRTYKVLLIENDEIDRLLVRTLVNARAPGCFQITNAEDLGHGLEALRQDSFDLLLLDHTIPDLSSIEELRLVLAEKNPPPVIIHTGYIEPRTEEEAFRLGVRDVVAKGELNPLWDAIERVLEHAGEPVTEPSGGKGKTILVVEDEPSVRRIISLALEFADYTVHQASNGEEALEQMHRQSSQIDLVIADLLMPRAGGDRLAHALQRIRPGLPVLFVSGASDDDLLRRLGRMPAEDEVLWKPFTPEQLVSRVESMLAQAHRS